MARAIDLVTIDELYAAGADIILHPPSIVADEALTELQKIELRGAAWQLMTYLKSLDPGRKIGIIVHDNPDPDAIAGGSGPEGHGRIGRQGRRNRLFRPHRPPGDAGVHQPAERALAPDHHGRAAGV